MSFQVKPRFIDAKRKSGSDINSIGLAELDFNIIKFLCEHMIYSKDVLDQTISLKSEQLVNNAFQFSQTQVKYLTMYLNKLQNIQNELQSHGDWSIRCTPEEEVGHIPPETQARTR